jgi:parvulin-like peptidyl-prolyl isomerase
VIAVPRSWLREPLVHFVVAGALLFAVDAWRNRDAVEPRGVVRITSADVEWLSATWTRQRQRAPSNEELRRLVADSVREELLAREARALGLDEDDTVVRRRLAQKMEFILQDAVRLTGPDEAELRRSHARDAARYRSAAGVSFTQIFFRSDADAQRAVVAIETTSPGELGDPTLLARTYDLVDQAAVADLFGSDFAERLFELEPGRWSEPIRSQYGFHVVRVTERRAAKVLAFEDVRERVREDWLRDRRSDAEKLLLHALLEKYELIVDDAVEPWLGPLADANR